jgi:hypothetical protein
MNADQLKILFLIVPVIFAGVIVNYLAKAFRIGRIRGRSVTYERATAPFGFWTAVLMYVLMVATVCLVGVNSYLSP